MEKWRNELECEINIRETFHRKVKGMKDKKLSAFCFKLLHRILTCAETLYHWKKISSPLCTLCKCIHSVKHMLWECDNAKYVWSYCNQTLNIILSWKDIVIGIGENVCDYLISQLAFLLYKAWILEINDKKVKNLKSFLYHELNNKKQIYNLIGQPDISMYIENIMSCFL